MRSGGFPCRVASCGLSFQVSDQRSMASLTAASAERSDHEVAAHDYHHVRLGDGATTVWGQRTADKPRQSP